MKKILLGSAVALAMIVSVSSCKKDDDKSRTEYLTQAGWIQTKGEVGTGGIFVSDGVFGLAACDDDDITTFKTDKTYVITEGATKCDPSDPDEVTSTDWALSADEKSLTIGTVSGVTYTINTLDNNTLQIQYDFSGATHRETYKH